MGGCRLCPEPEVRTQHELDRVPVGGSGPAFLTAVCARARGGASSLPFRKGCFDGAGFEGTPYQVQDLPNFEGNALKGLDPRAGVVVGQNRATSGSSGACLARPPVSVHDPRIQVREEEALAGNEANPMNGDAPTGYNPDMMKGRAAMIQLISSSYPAHIQLINLPKR